MPVKRGRRGSPGLPAARREKAAQGTGAGRKAGGAQKADGIRGPAGRPGAALLDAVLLGTVLLGAALLTRARKALQRASAAGVARATAQARRRAALPPPGPFQPKTWRSPLRGLWLTSVLGAVLLVGLSIMVATGLLSYAAYDPRLGNNDTTAGAGGLLKFYFFNWPTHPAWLYRVDQGIHITVGLALLPIVLAKLWSVLPRLFAWPPVKSPAQGLERLSLVMIVGGVLFEFATGILNIQNYYVFPFSFYTAHLYGAWVFIAGLVTHVGLKFPHMLAGLRSRSLIRELRTPLSGTVPEEPDAEGLRAQSPARPTISRRGLLAGVGGASLTLAGLVAGQSIGGWTRRTSLFGPRGLSATGPHAFPVNRTAASIGLTDADVGPAYRLVLAGPRQVTLTRQQVQALPQYTEVLPIACVEGWSAAASWTGVRLVDLARLAGVTRPGPAHVESIERKGSFRKVFLSTEQVNDPRSLLALQANGAELSRDHGYPARTVIPDAPGVHNTKWVGRIIFLEQA